MWSHDHWRLGSENDQRLPLDLSTTICFHEAVVDLLEIMKSVIEMFGPFLLQNLSLMLVYWLLHVYNVAFLGGLMLKTINETPDGQTIFMQGLALAGSALVIGWVLEEWVLNSHLLLALMYWCLSWFTVLNSGGLWLSPLLAESSPREQRRFL